MGGGVGVMDEKGHIIGLPARFVGRLRGSIWHPKHPLEMGKMIIGVMMIPTVMSCENFNLL